MKPTLHRKLEVLLERYQELEGLLSQPDIIGNQEQYRTLAKEYAELEPVVAGFKNYEKLRTNLEETEALTDDDDPDLRAMALEEADELRNQLERADLALQRLLLPTDPNDARNIYLEVRAGTGGDEAALFAGDIFRMYCRYAEGMKWQVQVLSEKSGEHGGYKEVICRIIGRDVYSKLKFESGAHRVQRVPDTESQGRIHTSACTVAILPEVDDIEGIDINKTDLRIDTFRASGAGGQHVNKTDSAVRLTHLPTGIVVECQDERSQHKNKARAMSLLQARLLSQARQQQTQERAETRRDLVGSGDRSEKIRTYNFPQGRVTDHRINLTIYRLSDTLEGNLDLLIEPLIQENQADLLATLED